MTAKLALGFDFDAADEDFRNELLHSDSADRSETAGENGLYLDDELTARGKAGRLTVVWTFKGSALLRHSSGQWLMAMNEQVVAAGWKA